MNSPIAYRSSVISSSKYRRFLVSVVWVVGISFLSSIIKPTTHNTVEDSTDQKFSGAVTFLGVA
jgi:hypothetical protein